tara:strand:- start:267 stop:1082 length:816 start_codon:yes stop_codon:yes gene_type:complete
MSQCYKFKEITSKYGIFDKGVDATYILTMKKNGNYKNIEKQLRFTKPTKKIFLVINESFKTCSKQLKKNTSTYDIVHSYIEIFKNAKKMNFQNILILEDDFIFEKEISFLKNTTHINNFCIENKKKDFILSLGSIPYIILPKNEFFYKALISTGSHSMIYSRSFIEKTLQKNMTNIEDWDYYTNTTLNRYIYYIPLCTQVFNETENQKNWNSFFGLKRFALFLFKLNNLDKTPQPGFDNFYFYSKIISIILFIICMYIIYKIIKTIKNLFY